MVEDGSHPLEWTVVHREYRDLFERRLQLTLQTVGVKEEELAESARESHGIAAWGRVPAGRWAPGSLPYSFVPVPTQIGNLLRAS